ncbi:MAG: branched-chain amino acid ABC transporter permease, partial [Nitrospinota bacterium]
REGVELMGVNPRLVYLITAGLGGALAGVVSVFFALQYSVYPDFGLRFVLLAFMIVVLGGLGNFMGSFISAFVISEILNISAVLASFEFANILVFVLFILMILVRPEGLLGQREGA